MGVDQIILGKLDELLKSVEESFNDLQEVLGEIQDGQVDISEKLDNISKPGADYQIENYDMPTEDEG